MNLTLVLLTFLKKHGCSKLMKHPLVISLLDYKWKKFGRYIFFGNLLIYLIFLVFLTAFALVIRSPVERPCKHILYKIFVCAHVMAMNTWYHFKDFVKLHTLLTNAWPVLEQFHQEKNYTCQRGFAREFILLWTHFWLSLWMAVHLIPHPLCT